MATVEANGKRIELVDGSPIKEAARELGVPFGCESGVCGTCQIEVVAGAEHLGALNIQEQDMGLDRTHRLCCQAKITSGTVTIKL